MSVVSARQVAVVLRERLPGLPTKKLHKLLYYCQGHHLATFGDPLFAETISAWDMGPVVGQLWHQEKATGPSDDARGELTEAQLNTIGYVVSRYGALTGQDLENLAHSETPWQQADGRRRPHESVRIEQEWLIGYFSTDGAADEDDDVPLDSDAVIHWLTGARRRQADELRQDSPEELRSRLSPSA
jgi:uncharacterized phage-associated protein